MVLYDRRQYFQGADVYNPCLHKKGTNCLICGKPKLILCLYAVKKIHRQGEARQKIPKNYKIALPTSRVKNLGLSADSRDVVMEFDGKKITISKAVRISQFAEKKKGSCTQGKVFEIL